MAIQHLQSTIVYPERDGKPMGETDAHVMAIIDTISALRDYYRSQPNVLVGGNMMMYYREGDNKTSVSPDTFVVVGVPNHSRRIYTFWEEGPPTMVFEYTSRSTRRDDTSTKVALYAELGIQEYVLFDPLREYLKPALHGYHLVGGRYEPAQLDADGWLASAALGLRMRVEGSRLRLVDAATGTPLYWPHENAERARAEAIAREAETEARQQAEAQIAALRAELARLRGES